MSAASLPARTHRRGIPVSAPCAARLQRETAERKQRIACCAAIKAHLLENLKPSTTKLELVIDPYDPADPHADCFCDTLWYSEEFSALCATFERWGGWKIKGFTNTVSDGDDDDSDDYKTTEVLSVTPIY